MKQIVLCNREDIRKVESEKQYEFTCYVLDKMGVPTEDVLPNDYEDFTVEHKIKLRDLLNKFEVVVSDDRDGGVTIYVKERLIAEWKKCHFVLRKDPSAKDPANRLYAEVHTDWWTIFDGEEQ